MGVTDNPGALWIGHEIKINGIRWRVVEASSSEDNASRVSVRYERVYDKALPAPPILRDPPPLTIPNPLETT